MTRITNADQVLLLLRAQLERANKLKRQARRGASSDAPKARPLEHLRSILAERELPQSERERALISALLVEDFGDAVLNEPQFQTLVDQVRTAIEQDVRASLALTQAIAALTSD